MKKYILKAQNISLISLLCAALFSFITYENNNRLIEDIYTQTDRPFYFPGETIWFKSYIVDEAHTITTISEAMYAELISPKGAVVKKLKIGINQGYAYGNFDTKQDWVGGIYTLKMYTNWMRNYGESAYFTKKITLQKIIRPDALLTLKFEKEGYGKSSNVIANFEAKDLKNNPIANKEITYEVAVKGKRIYSGTTTTNDQGKAKPVFTLPDDLNTIDVVLTVLLPYNDAKESISRSIPVVLDTIDLQFFPESGKIIAGTTNMVAFKAVNEFGKPVDVSGNIINQRGIVVTSFSSHHDGMGSFDLEPLPNTTYYAQVTAPFISEKKIELPIVYKDGTRFSVLIDSLNANVRLFSTIKRALRLEVSSPTKLLWSQNISKDQETVVVPTSDFPIGITRFTIYDAVHIPIAERLIFLNPDKKLNIEITTDKNDYETREKIEIKIKTSNRQGTPIPANVSVSVADNKLLSFADDKQDHIESYFLMSSELKGKIHNPVFYFDPKEPKAIKALDNVMLTHGWRDYLYTTKVNQESALYMPEREAIHKGVVVDKKGKPVKAHILIFDEHGNKVMVMDTNNEGSFACKLGSSSSYILIAYTDDQKALRIVDTTVEKGYDIDEKRIHRSDVLKEGIRIRGFSGVERPLKKTIKKNAEVTSIAMEENSAALEEVVVMGFGVQEKKMASGSIITIKSEAIEDAPDIAQILQGRVSGIQITNADGIYGNTSKINIRGASSLSGNNQPLYVVDGVLVPAEAIKELNPGRIESITVLKDAAATALYGCQGANGIIVISSKNKRHLSNWGKKKLNNAKFNNYVYHHIYKRRSLTNYTPRKFYIPVYDSKLIPEERSDFRNTIYWNPVVQTDEKGEATLSFYNSDAITSFKIIAEGIGCNGLVGHKEKTYSTKKLLSIDFKAPNYMVLHDTVALPIIIKNESSKTMETSLGLSLPKGMTLVEPIPSSIEILPNSTKRLHVRVIPKELYKKNEIVVAAAGGNYKDRVTKEVEVISPYFPTQVSISGSKNESYSFEVNHIVKNSLTADFTIYTDIVGDVMNGVESLIRQPYGCFEQTSSSTYPNILVLKYLKETGKNNPEITAKAIKYIEEGYKRLIGFETKAGGFEWFGKTPPHETLTAYGVLEFTEMKEIYPEVDQKMINRTVDWLMSRRDGKGGFKKSKQGYDSFASSPKEVADAYIVYAISEAGINISLEKEYNATYTKALQSNDAYQMALLVATSYNLNRPENGKRLLDILIQNIEEFGFKGLPVENTITRSYGDSKHIETAAFTVLALMKAQENNEVLISKGIEYLVSKRKDGRFGSTQATATALKALIEYTKNQKNKLLQKDQTIQLTINGKKLTEKLQTNEKGQIVMGELQKYIKEGEQIVTVGFSDPEITFPYEMNIRWDSAVPDTSKECNLQLKTTILDQSYSVGDNVRVTVEINNKSIRGVGMPMAIVGIPSGTTPQPWQLKELVERKEVAYYEVFENYLVFYWREFKPSEFKTIALDLKAGIPGVYQAPASCTYQYYADEYKHWIPGNILKITE